MPTSYWLSRTLFPTACSSDRNKIADWCSTAPPRYLLNVTRPEVSQFLAQYAYQLLAQSNFVSDGLFFRSEQDCRLVQHRTATVSPQCNQARGVPVPCTICLPVTGSVELCFRRPVLQIGTRLPIGAAPHRHGISSM